LPRSVTTSPDFKPARAPAEPPELAQDACGRVVDGDAERSAANLAELHDLIGDIARHVDGNGESGAGIGVAGTGEGSVDADELAAQVDERTTGIAGICVVISRRI
jgi:hypothetical protein